MNVSLTPKLEKMIQAKVQSGRDNSVSEVVRAALRLLEKHDSLRAIHLKELRSKIDEGLASLDRGEGVDGDKFMRGMLKELDSKQATRKAV